MRMCRGEIWHQLAIDPSHLAHQKRGSGIDHQVVPRISSFFGIVIAMYHNEAHHRQPHFHARYAEHEASIAIESLEVLAGALPSRAESFVREWAVLHRDELRTNWERARDEEPLEPIEPLT